MYLAILEKIVKNRNLLMFEKIISTVDIKRLPHRYSEVSLGSVEQISKHISDFGLHAAKYGFIS